MTNRFTTTNTGKAAFVNLYNEDKSKVIDTNELTKLAELIEAGQCKVECFINKDGEPTMMIKL